MKSPFSPEVEALLRCPTTQQLLRLATKEELKGLEDSLPEGGWITEDLTRIYPIRDGFPVLVANDCVTRNTDSSD